MKAFRNRLASGVPAAILLAAGIQGAAAQDIEAESGSSPITVLSPIDVASDIFGGDVLQDPADAPSLIGIGGVVGAEGPLPANREQTVLTNRITQAELEGRQIESAEDIDRLDPAVTYNSNNDSFNIRGLDGNRVLTTIDGIRLPWLDDGARGVSGGQSAFDFDSLATIDLVKGADSSIYGAGALGGIVGLRTFNPEDFLEGGKVFGGRSRVSYDSADESYGADQVLAARAGNSYFLVQGGYRAGRELDNQGGVGGFGADRTEPNPLDYDEINLLAKARHHLTPGQVIGVTGEYYDREADVDLFTSGSAIFVPNRSTYRNGTTVENQGVKRQRYSIDYELGQEAGLWLDGANLVGYYQKQELQTDFRGIRAAVPTGPYRRLSEREQSVYGVNGSALKIVETGPLAHAVSIGGEFFASEASQLSTGEDSCPPGPYSFRYFYACTFLNTNQADMPDVDGTTLGLFLQDEIAFNDRFRLTPAIRYDYYEQNPQETAAYRANSAYRSLPDASSDEAFSPKLRAEFDAFDELTLYAQYARAFRAPTAVELYLTYGSPGTYLRIGNPDLQPETSDGYEAGFLFGDGFFEGRASGFYNRYEDFIDTVDADPSELGLPPGLYPFGITRTINRDKVEIMGLELAGRLQLDPDWHVGASFAAYNGRDVNTDENLASIPAARGIFNLGYDTGDLALDAYLRVAAARDDLENEISQTPAYAVLDLTAQWEPERLEGVKLVAGVFNVFDETYYDALDLPSSASQPKEFYSEPGRNVRASLSFDF